MQPILVHTVPMDLHLHRTPVLHGKWVLRKVIPMVKDELLRVVHQVIQALQPQVHHKRKHNLVAPIPIQLNIHMLVGVLVNHKVLKDHHLLVHLLINTITEPNRRMDHPVHSHIKHLLATITSRPMRHLHPITVVDERAHI